MQNNKTAILILAAGASTRMNRPKQLLKWGNSTVLETVFTTAQRVGFVDVFVVVGANNEAIEAHLTIPNEQLIYCSQWQNGMGDSLAFGVQELKKKSYSSVLIVLGDQPLISDAYLTDMIHVFMSENSTIVATKYMDTVGVPTIFGKKHFDELIALKGDSGAKKVINKYKDDVVFLNNSEGVLDIDTEEDYLRAKKEFNL